jgi:catechol 2,3-dioxygenase-like lactoylglutathione lyase family enzyme
VLPSAVPTLHSIAPFFIVENLQSSLDFYQSKLGFDIAYKGGGDGHGEDFWAFVRRDGVMINLKQIALRFIRSRIIRATNGRAGTLTSTPPTPTCCTKSMSVEPFRCTSI